MHDAPLTGSVGREAAAATRPARGPTRGAARDTHALAHWAWHAASLLRGGRSLLRDYREVATASTPERFVHEALARLGIVPVVDAGTLDRVPANGPVVIVANHPFGGADGLVLLEVVLRRRPDLRVLATRALQHLAPLAPLVIAVDNFDRGGGVARNVAPLRSALRHVSAGGALLMFPAGVVSHLDLRERCVIDPPWSAASARLVRTLRAPVLPVHVAGRNSDAFQLAGVLHPALRTLMLPAELGNKRGARVAVRIGAAWPASRVGRERDDAELAAKLRLDVYALGAAGIVTAVAPGAAPVAAAPEPVAAAADATSLAREIEALPASCRLASCGTLDVYAATSAQLRGTLLEIGRLRELAFRAVGEGTGRAVDLDRFDRHYHHLFAWDRETHRIAGAYRIGRTDEIRRAQGRRGLYLDSLFELREPLLALLGPSLELGRSFVHPEYQRSFAPLLALWRGIAAYVAREPRYARLIGPVSIPAGLDPVSIELLVRFLRRRHFDPLLSRLVEARNPFRASPSLATLGAGVAGLPGLEALSGYLAVRDPLGRGVPVLLRQYLKLGGRVLGFHVDAGFGSCIDCLTVVDLRIAPDTVLGKYMPPEQLASFRKYWKGRAPRLAAGRERVARAAS